MAPNLKRNKTPIVLSCIYFHWKQPFSCTVLSPSGIFRMIPYLLIHEIHGDGLPQISGLLGPAVSLSEQTMYWPYPACTQVFTCFGKETRSNLIPPGVLIDFTFLPVAGLSAWTCSGMFVSCFVGEKSVYCWEVNRSCRWLGPTHFWGSP